MKKQPPDDHRKPQDGRKPPLAYAVTKETISNATLVQNGRGCFQVYRRILCYVIQINGDGPICSGCRRKILAGEQAGKHVFMNILYCNNCIEIVGSDFGKAFDKTCEILREEKC